MYVLVFILSAYFDVKGLPCRMFGVAIFVGLFTTAR